MTISDCRRLRAAHSEAQCAQADRTRSPSHPVSIVRQPFACYFPGTCMEESAYLPWLRIQNSDTLDSLRHSALVRLTHWINTVRFLALVLSGIAILLAHPHPY